MWKSSIQRTFTPAPIKSAPDTAPPTTTFNPRPITRPTVSHSLEQVDVRAPPPIPLPSLSRPSDHDKTVTPSYPRPLSGAATRPAIPHFAPRSKLQGLVIYVEWGRRNQTKQEFFAFLDCIRDHGGLTTNSLTDSNITHFLLSGPTEERQQAYTYNQVTRRFRYKYHQVIRDHSKWFLPGCNVLDQERNEKEKRTRLIVLKGWLWDVLDGRLGVKEEGEWGIYLKPEVDERRGRGLNLNPYERERPSRNRQEVESATSSRIRLDESHHNRNDSTSSGYFATPPLSATRLHAEVEPTIIRGLSSPTYQEQSSEDPWIPSSAYFVTPPSATIALPDPATAPIKSTLTLLPIRQIEFCPPQSHRKYTSPPIHSNVQSTGLFTPPPSASPPPPPVMRSPEYIMIPKSHLASEAYVWRPPSEEEEVDTRKYEDSPSPVNEDIGSPSYSPIPTLSDPGTPIPLQLEVTVEEATKRPPADRQVSFGIKRPRPRSPVGVLNDRPMAKRQSLPCMQSRSISRSDSPLSPLPDEPDDNMLEDEEEEFEDGLYEKQEELITQDEEEEDKERFSSPGPSPSPSISDYQDSNFDSETGCEPAEFDDEPDVVAKLYPKSIDEFDLSTFDLGRLVVDCDITDQLAGLLEAWI